MQTRLKLLDARRRREGFGDGVFDEDLFERKKIESEMERENRDR